MAEGELIYMNIKLTEKTIVEIRELGFLQNEIGSVALILNALHRGETPLLDKFDDDTTNKSALTLYKTLEHKGLIQSSKGGGVIYKISEKGLELLHSLEETNVPPPIKPTAPAMSIKEWMGEWCSLWKDEKGIGYRTIEGRSLACTPREALPRMEKFLRDYKDLFKDLEEGEIKSIIIEATASYIREFKKRAFLYCREAVYFIMKQEAGGIKSTLANECETEIARRRNSISKEGSIFDKSL